MRLLVTGAGGMLAREMLTALEGRSVTALTRHELDITAASEVTEAVAGHDVVINLAADTRVDDAESDEDTARMVNAVGPANLASAAAANGAKLVQVSTDHVFDGTARVPYSEHAPVNPINAYGRTKAEGEQRVAELHPGGAYVVRTAWLYGSSGLSFPSTILRQAESGDEVPVVADEFGQPTWNLDLAHQIVALIDSEAPAGIYHATNAGQASRYDLARALLEEYGLDPEQVRPVTGESLARPAPRPMYTVLGHDGWASAGLSPMRGWREALSAAIKDGSFA